MKNFYILIFLISSYSHLFAQFAFNDSANNYSGNWANNSNQGSGFNPWLISTSGANAGVFIGNPSNSGISTVGIGTNAFALYGHTGHFVNAVRYFGSNGNNIPMQIGDEFSFYWGMNWDAGAGNKGIDLRSDTAVIFNVNNSGSSAINTTNGIADSNYGTDAMLVTLTRTTATQYTFSMTSRSGGTTYSTTINSNQGINNINIYCSSQSDNNGNRNIFFDNFTFTKSSNYEVATNINEPRILSGSNGLDKGGVSTLTLSNANTYTGLTTINAGTLQLNNSSGNTLPSTNNIVVNDQATLRVSSKQTLNNLTVNTGGIVIIDSNVSLKINGVLSNNGQIFFKSDATGSGMFDQYSGSPTGSGSVTVERYIPARRAFRFLSPSVTTIAGSTIYTNWQENGSNTAGFGTQITGTGGATNGFDVTSTNNPSLFTFTNGAWSAVTNTNVNTLTAGTPYRLMVRGDRTISLATNTPTPTNTILRTTGTLKTGNFTPTINQTADGLSFVGNPYQAPVDIKTILTASSTNMNTGVVYYWDPTLNTRGGFVTRTLSANTNDVTSNFNEYVQPGQAVFVKRDNTANAASITITESHKSINNAAAGVFKTITDNDFGILRANLQANMENQWQTTDAALAIFNNNYTWNVTAEDATKMTNLDEEVSFMQDNTSLAIAMQNNPAVTNELPIKIDKLRHTNYQWSFNLENYSGYDPYLLDMQNNTMTAITNETVVPFTTTGTISNRFKIVFQGPLSTPDFSQQITLYPNPGKTEGSFYVTGISSEVNVSMHNLLGQSIPLQTIVNGSIHVVQPSVSLSQGVYLVSITSEGNTQQVKWIVE